MAARYLVIEDLGFRSDEFARIASELTDEGHQRIDVDFVTRVRDLLDDRDLAETGGRSFPVERLATYDGFFVDFHLNTERLGRGYGTLFTLRSVAGHDVNVMATTGMGVFLYLRQRLESPEYREARGAVLARYPSRAKVPPMYSFSDLSHVVTKFSAPASRSWFGAEHFSMLVDNPKILKYQLAHLDTLATSPHGGSEVRRAAKAFDNLMATPVAPRSAGVWNHRPAHTARVVDEMYDWLGLYLRAAGKRGSLPAFLDAVEDNFGIRPDWQDNANQYAPVALQMQLSVASYLNVFNPAGAHDWPTGWTTRTPEQRAADPLWDTLNESRFFWEAEDVRAALFEHRERQKTAVM